MSDDAPALATIKNVFEQARHQWPEFGLSFAELQKDLTARRVDYATLTPALAMDVFLAAACLWGNVAAIRVFRNRYTPVVSNVARRFDPASAFADEVMQHVYEHLLVAVEGQIPRIHQYTGEGSLSSFVATVAHRLASRLYRYAKRYQADEALVEKLMIVEDQETLFLKAHYLRVLNQSLLTAVRRLDRRARILLRLNLVERVSTIKLAAMYRVNQSTISRRIQGVIADIFSSVKQQAREELGLDTVAFTSALELVRSQLELRLSQFADTEGE